MTINLIGLLEDGSPPRAGAPTNARKAIRVSVGQSVTIRLRVVTLHGLNVSLASPAALALTVKKRPTGSPLFQATPTIAADGAAEFVIAPADLKQQAPGQYVYDIWLTVAGQRDAVVPLSPLHLEATATPPP